jgi:hypothetical protein
MSYVAILRNGENVAAVGPFRSEREAGDWQDRYDERCWPEGTVHQAVIPVHDGGDHDDLHAVALQLLEGA